MAKQNKKQIDTEHKEWQKRYLIKAKQCALNLSNDIGNIIRNSAGKTPHELGLIIFDLEQKAILAHEYLDYHLRTFDNK
jgi:hypothetical protein